MIYWIFAVLLFGIVITLHELGHFWAARLTKVAVLEFAVGIGPKLFSFTPKSGITYSLRALPFGGYCRFLGEEEEAELAEVSALRMYHEEKLWKRALISFGGPLMNYLAAFLLIVLLLVGYEQMSVNRSITEVGVGSPAEAAGLQVGDRITAVNGIKVGFASDVSALVSASGEGEALFEIKRGKEKVELNITPRYDDAEGRYLIGIVFGQHGLPGRLWQSARLAVFNIGKMSSMIFDLLRDAIFKGEGTKNLAGPIGTVVEIKNITEQGGLRTYVELTAMISVNLGLFNLLPIPGLDGSKLLFLLVEKIRRKRMDPNKEGIVTMVGLGLMVLLMVIVMVQDITRLVG